MITEAQAILPMSAKDWTDIVVAVAAIAALIVSARSFSVSARALRLSELQEQRKQPRLVPRLLDSYYKSLCEGVRVYSFSLSVANPTDSDNAIAQIEMHLRYRIDDSVSITVKLTPSFGIDTSAEDTYRRLTMPSRVAAHDTVSGWCDFVIMPDITNGHIIDVYQIVLTDSHQVETGVDAFIVNEQRRAL